MRLDANFFGPGGRLASVFPSYEERISQQQLCLAIAETITNGGILLAEAGTGTGKTVAYLVPAIAGTRYATVLPVPVPASARRMPPLVMVSAIARQSCCCEIRSS